MPKYGQRSRTNLEECHPDLQLVFQIVINFYDHSIIEGHRPEEEQNKAFHAGRSKLKYPQSKHNQYPSMACDAVPYPINWKQTDEMCFFAGVVVGIANMLYDAGQITHLIRWGGDWDKDGNLYEGDSWDKPHFELYKPEGE